MDKMDGCGLMTRKRRQLNDNGPPARRQRVECSGHPNSSEEMLIVDLNDDCLESILKHLDINDLLNVVMSNSRFQDVASSVFKHKYGQNTIEILFQRSQYIKKIGCFLEIRNLKTCLQFLRHFGHSIAKLKVAYMFKSRQQFALIDQYIDKYCVDTVKELQFLGFRTPEILVQNPRKPFQQVERISVMDSNLGRQLPQFVGWFPNLQQLSIDWSTVDWSCAAVNFPQLKHLRLFDVEIGSTFGVNNMAALLRSNPQLESLEIDSFQRQITYQEFTRMIWKNSALTKLILRTNLFKPNIRLHQLSALTQILPALTELNMRSYDWNLSIKCFSTLIQQKNLGQLKKIQFWSRYTSNGDVSCLELDNGWHATIKGREITLMRTKSSQF